MNVPKQSYLLSGHPMLFGDCKKQNFEDICTHPNTKTGISIKQIKLSPQTTFKIQKLASIETRIFEKLKGQKKWKLVEMYQPAFVNKNK